MEAFDSLIPALAYLRSKGYTVDFNLKENCLMTSAEGFSTPFELGPEDFEVEHTYRFDANTDPDEQAVLYAISAPGYGIKGVLVNSYSIYANTTNAAIMAKLG